jgi:hypothetical protein
MSRETLLATLSQLETGIKACADKKLQLPALMLAYTAIDICGWLACTDAEGSVRKNFIQWTEKYLLPARQLPCTSLDLYSARCGLLHSYTPESRLVSEGAAKRIYYAWGNANAADLQRAIEHEGRTDLVAIHVSDFLEAFGLGLAAYFADLDSNPALAAAFDSKAAVAFAPMATQVLTDYLRAVECEGPDA